jgi:hypothetical protein
MVEQEEEDFEKEKTKQACRRDWEIKESAGEQTG